MFFQCSTESFNVDLAFIKKFVASCHFHYLRRYNIYGRHRLGWGFAYIPEGNPKALIIKRDITPIYKSDWRNLSRIKTKFLLVHARKAKPWYKNIRDVHPINIGEKFSIAHNGSLKRFPTISLVNNKLERIKNSTSLDTRKYLCHIIDGIKNNEELKPIFEKFFNEVHISSSANAFLFNSQECFVVNQHNNDYKSRHHTLFIEKSQNKINVCTTPILKNAKEIANSSLIRINLNNLELEFNKLSISD